MAHKRAACVVAALLLGGAWAEVRAQDCVAPALGAQAGALRSHWEEFDAQGRSLVRERGTLRGTALSLDLPCGPRTWSAQLGWSRGTRDYDDLSNTGLPLASRSRIAATELALQGLQALDDGWSAGLRLSHRRLRRVIADSGAVLGYPERFAYWQAGLGLRHERALTPALVMSATAWAGGGPGGHLSVQLPRTDPARLKLGRSRFAQLGLQIGSAPPPSPTPGWSWQAGWHYLWERLDAGPAQALTRNGIPVGGAAQPRTEQRRQGLDLAVQYRF